ncbi:XRE family transcriptional regulator [Caballeronia sp. INML5]|uniref:helix-turn-helix domain-containing protein n=1 Tax=Caballeronia sp. INML5 TaxID=2921750 RepID=UPI0032EC5EDC
MQTLIISTLLGISQPTLSQLMRGQFRGVSEAKLLELLARLGRNVQIVVGPPRRSAKPGRESCPAADIRH